VTNLKPDSQVNRCTRLFLVILNAGTNFQAKVSLCETFAWKTFFNEAAVAQKRL